MSGVLATAALKIFMMFLPSVLHFIITSTLHLKVRSERLDHWWPILPSVCFYQFKAFTDEFAPRKQCIVYIGFKIPYIFFVRLHDKSAGVFPSNSWRLDDSDRREVWNNWSCSNGVPLFWCCLWFWWPLWDVVLPSPSSSWCRWEFFLIEPAGCKLKYHVSVAYWFGVVVSMKDFLF